MLNGYKLDFFSFRKKQCPLSKFVSVDPFPLPLCQQCPHWAPKRLVTNSTSYNVPVCKKLLDFLFLLLLFLLLLVFLLRLTNPSNASASRPPLKPEIADQTKYANWFMSKVYWRTTQVQKNRLVQHYQDITKCVQM